MDCKKVLLDDLLPFWTERLIDREDGGVFTYIEENGDVNTEKKHIWLVSRTLWTYSSVCNMYGKEEKYVHYKEKVEQVIFRYFSDKRKKMFYCNIDANGKPLDFSGHGDLFHIPRALMVIDSSKTFFAASHENNSDLEK